MFLGPVKSGGSLTGALLDAHPSALVSDEVDVLRYAECGFERDQILDLVARGSQREADKGRVTARRLGGYSLAVPGGSQGRATTVRLMGDTRAGPTTRRLGDDPSLLDLLARTLAPVPLSFVQVVRNPFDPIAAMRMRGRRTEADAIEDFAGQCRRLCLLRSVIGPDNVEVVRYENLVAEPAAELSRLCAALGLDLARAHIDAAAKVVVGDRERERDRVEWSNSAIDTVDQLVAETPFLEDYR